MGLFGKSVKDPEKQSFLKRCGKKREKSCKQHFLLFPHVFYSSHNKFLFLCQIYLVVYKYFQFGPVYNFIIWYIEGLSTPEAPLKPLI